MLRILDILFTSVMDVKTNRHIPSGQDLNHISCS